MTKSSQIVKDNNRIIPDTVLKYLISIFQRLFLRLFTAPVHALVAAPWLFALFLYTETNGQVQDIVYRIVSWLAWKPRATSLDEGDLALAVVTLFLIMELPYIIHDFKSGKVKTENNRVTADNRHLRREVIIAAIGWLVVMPGFNREMGWQAVGIAVMLFAGSCVFFFAEYATKRTFRHIRNTFAVASSKIQM